MPHFPVCTICGLLVGDKILHDKWHRDLDARIERSMYVTKIANWGPEELK